METAIYLDLIALIPPAAGLSLLLRRKTSLHEIKSATVVRANTYFMAAISFDILTNLGFAWAIVGTLFSLFFLFSAVGFLAATLCFCPGSRSVRESLSKNLRSISFLLYEQTILGWLVVTLYLQSPYLPANIVLWGVTTTYPTVLFLQAKKRANAAHVKDMLTILSATWFGLGLVILPTILVGTLVPALSLPSILPLTFLAGSLFYYFMARAVTDPTGLSRLWMSRLVPQTIIELGRRYLILHDTGSRTLSFLSNTFKNMIESGNRVIVRSPRRSWLLETLTRTDPKFGEWMKDGRLVSIAENETPNTPIMQAISERVSLGTTSTIFVRSLEPRDLLAARTPSEENPKEKSQMTSELFLLESSKTPRPQLNEFLKRNDDIHVLDLSEPKEYFSALVNLQHARIHGSKILLEYDSSSDLGIVDKFFMEGIAYAEKCVLFTSKSSNLYRAIKGKELIKTVAASSLVSVPDELPDGEVQIPDRELGLVTSIASDLLENNKTTAVRFVFDSITELIRSDHWEQLYSGIKQLVELLSVQHATAIFLVNRDTFDPKFLGALRALFSVQMKQDSVGLQVTKLSNS